MISLTQSIARLVYTLTFQPTLFTCENESVWIVYVYSTL